MEALNFKPVQWASGYVLEDPFYSVDANTAFPNGAPSHHKHLWRRYLTLFDLALQGYAVVGTGYASLGAARATTGAPIPHEYLALPVHADDVFHSVQAAPHAFPALSKHSLIAGHVQGGSAALRQAGEPVHGLPRGRGHIARHQAARRAQAQARARRPSRRAIPACFVQLESVHS